MYRSACIAAWLSLCVVLAGCRSGATMMVWTPPLLQSAVEQQVLVAPLVGDPQQAPHIFEAMLSERPRDAGRQLTAVTPSVLQREASGSVMLASAIEAEDGATVSDLTLLALARQAGVEWLLMGEVLASSPIDRRVALPIDADDSSDPSDRSDAGDRLSIAWRLYDVAAAKPIADRALSIDHEAAREKYPDLAASDVDAGRLLARAAARDAWALLTPSLEQTAVHLAHPRGWPGSKAIRAANALAAQGSWQAAEQQWQSVLDKHPGQHAAMHNLAIAAVARQDFSAARQQIVLAMRRSPRTLYRETSVWIERQQRIYHNAFQLPDPPEGWIMTNH